MSFALRPNARIAIDGQSLSAAEAGLESVAVTLAVGAHGQAVLHLWPSSKFSSATPGSTLTVALGEDDTPVLTGSVTGVTDSAGRVLIESLDATGPLSRTRMSTTFRDMSTADIVKALASEAGVATDTVDTGPTFEAYAIDHRASLWRHLLDLAALTGADVMATADGKLRFAAGSGAGVRQLRKGADLLDWRTASVSPRAPSGFGTHGAASRAGAQNWHHVLADPLGGNPPPSRVPGAARSRDVADRAAEAAALRSARSATRGTLLALGNAAFRPGDRIEILEPGGGGGLLDAGAAALGAGTGAGGQGLRVLGVRHRLDAATGFTTALTFEGTGDDASVGGGLGALAGGLG